MVCHTDVPLSAPCKGNGPKQTTLTSLAKNHYKLYLQKHGWWGLEGEKTPILSCILIYQTVLQWQERTLLCNLGLNAVCSFYL